MGNRGYRRSLCTLAAWALAAILLAGCGSDAWFGDGPGATASVTTPSGIQTGNVTLNYVLSGEDISSSDITVKYSKDGLSFLEASEGPGSDGTKDLSVSAGGDSHAFVWDSARDLGETRQSAVYLGVFPEGGTADNTGPIQVHNGRFLAAVENRTAGRVWLYSLDAVEGDLSFLRSVETGGQSPYDVIYEHPWFLVAEEDTSDVAVLKLDEGARTLVPSDGSPFKGDGAGAKYLATDGRRVFVSNVGGGTISIFDLSADTGVLKLNQHSGVLATGCRALAVRSGRLYISSPSSGGILIFDIASDGELFTNGASPVTSGGLVSPGALAISGTRLYAVNESTPSLCGFNIQGDGGLSAIAGSPFAISSAGVGGLARVTGKLFAVNGAGAQLLSLSVDAFGAVTEDAGSPLALTAPSSGVAAAGSVAVAATEAGKLEVWTIDELGSLSVADSSPLSVPVDFVRLAISD